MAFRLKIRDNKKIDGCIIVQDTLDIDEFAKLVEGYTADDEDWLHAYRQIDPTTQGCVFFHRSGKWVMCLWRYKDAHLEGVFVHEMVHVVERWFRNDNIPMTLENEELKAHMHEQLFTIFKKAYAFKGPDGTVDIS